jgi:hypothetical protein
VTPTNVWLRSGNRLWGSIPAAPSSDYVGFRVYLGLRNQSQAEALARSVSDPASASYGRYLTTGQFQQAPSSRPRTASRMQSRPETTRGVTVAVIDAYASPTIESDANTYSSRHGLRTFSPDQFTQVVAPGTYRHPPSNAQHPQGWYGEETLDVEAVHTMAPGAKIVYVGAPNNYQDLDAALNHVISRRLADIVTNSYGLSTELLPPREKTPGPHRACSRLPGARCPASARRTRVDPVASVAARLTAATRAFVALRIPALSPAVTSLATFASASLISSSALGDLCSIFARFALKSLNAASSRFVPGVSWKAASWSRSCGVAFSSAKTPASPVGVGTVDPVIFSAASLSLYSFSASSSGAAK